jgi:hypothetical protein
MGRVRRLGGRERKVTGLGFWKDGRRGDAPGGDLEGEVAGVGEADAAGTVGAAGGVVRKRKMSSSRRFRLVA